MLPIVSRDTRSYVYKAWKKVLVNAEAFSKNPAHSCVISYDTRWDKLNNFIADFQTELEGEFHAVKFIVKRKSRSLPWNKENCYISLPSSEQKMAEAIIANNAVIKPKRREFAKWPGIVISTGWDSILNNKQKIE